jgi:hypothetical protein
MSQRGLSTRRSCALCGISLSSNCYRPTAISQLLSANCYQPPVEKQANDRELDQRLHQIAHLHEDYGYRRAHQHLRNQHLRNQHLRNQHLRNQHLRNQHEVINHKRVQRVWRLEGLSLPLRRSCRKVRTGAITDEFTRKNLAVITATSIRAERVRQE